MKNWLAWIIFALASVTCLVWIGFGVRDDMRESSVFHNIIAERLDIAESSNEVHVGVVGNWKEYNDLLRGIKMAAQDINEKGGILGRKIVLEIKDDEGTVDKALAVAQELSTKPEVAFVIGHTSPALNAAVAQNYEFYQVLHLAPISSSEHQSQTPFTMAFENGMPPSQPSKAVIRLAKKEGWSRLGLIYLKGQTTEHRARRFESLANQADISVPISYAYEGPGTGITFHMERWKREVDVDAIIIAVDFKTTIPLIQAARDVGLEMPIVNFGPAPPPKHSEVFAPLAPLYFFSHDASSAPPPAPGLQQYEKTEGHRPRIELMLGYDSLSVLAQTITRIDSFIPAVIAQALRGHKVEYSYTDTVRFDEHGTAEKTPISFARHEHQKQSP